MNIDIMGESIEVKLYSKSEMGDGKYAGRALLLANKIKIWEDMSKQRQEATLIHEFLHFADDRLLLEMSDEAIVRLSNFLSALINDNPDTFKFTPKLEE